MPQPSRSRQKNASSDQSLPFTIYATGGLITYRDLAMNLVFKDAIWHQYGGKYQLILPQSE